MEWVGQMQEIFIISYKLEGEEIHILVYNYKGKSTRTLLTLSAPSFQTYLLKYIHTYIYIYIFEETVKCEILDNYSFRSIFLFIFFLKNFNLFIPY